MTHANRVAVVLVGALLCAAVPHTTSASVSITEIMYDLQGADSGREWVEVTNLGTSPVDLTGYKFFQGGTNHGFSFISNSGVLEPLASAVIVADAAKFAADWPSYTGVEYKSSFSLSNSGETIALKDSAGVAQDTVTYDASMGASGDGNSLERRPSGITAHAPNPGTYVQQNPDSTPMLQTATTSTTTPASTPPATGGSVGSPTLSVQILGDAQAMVGAGSFFSAKAFLGQSPPPLPARFIWNFGDGATAEGQSVFHVYSYPGTYSVHVTAALGYSAGTARQSVSAIPADIRIHAETDGSLVIVNRAKSDVDVGFWHVAQGVSTFLLPEDTTILANGGIRIAPNVLHFFATNEAQLLYPNGMPVAVPIVAASVPRPQVLSPAEVEALATPGTTAPTHAPPSSPQDTSPGPTSPPLQSAVVAQSGIPVSLDVWLLGLGALLVLGGALAWYVHAVEPTPETSLSADEFEVE